MDDDEHKTSSSSPVVISGILFSRSIRSGFASFILAPISSSLSSAITTTDDVTEIDQSQSPILVRLQFTDSTQELRSFCRKQYKIGDQIDVLCTNNGQWQRSSERSSTPSLSSSRSKNQQQNWSQQPRWVVGLSSTLDAQKTILIRTSRVWSMRDCQQYQLRYLPQNKKDKQQQRQQQQQSDRRKRKNNNNDDDDDDDDAFVHTTTTTTTRGTNTDNSSQKEQHTQQQQQQRQSSHLNGDDDDNLRRISNNYHGGGGKEKLLQAQELVSFLMQLIGNKLSNSQEQPGIEKDANVTSTMDIKEVPTLDYVSNTTTNIATATNSPTMMTTATIKQIQQQQHVRDWLNRGVGVLDVAGGCGHVSMALGMNGILSTVVDARESVGKLPKKDRKIWKRSLLNKPQRQQQQQQQQQQRRRQKTQQVEEETQPPQTYNSDHTIISNTHYHQTPTAKEISDYKFCQLVVPPPVVVPFQSQRAWFGSKPCGYDESYRHPDEGNLPILVATAILDNDSDDHSKDNKEAQDGKSSNYDGTNNDDMNDVQGDALLRRQTSALVALHPDEATGEIVQQAVKHRIPFVVVPCCVFARLFPERQTNNGQSVSSYESLLEYLQELDTSIQRTQFGFAGKNIALWSTFPDG